MIQCGTSYSSSVTSSTCGLALLAVTAETPAAIPSFAATPVAPVFEAIGVSFGVDLDVFCAEPLAPAPLAEGVSVVIPSLLFFLASFFSFFAFFFAAADSFVC